MSFQQGLSGLNASSKNLEIIGNNIANANTFGAKAARAEFSAMYASSLNGAKGDQAGIGVSLGTVAQQFTQGAVTTTSNNLDLAINGRGFFQMQGQDEVKYYTRNGQFKIDREGFVVNNEGYYLLMQDWDPASGRADGDAVKQQLKTGLGAAQATGMGTDVTNRGITLAMNLKANDVAKSAPIDYADPASYNYSASQTIYDPQGAPLSMTYYFVKLDTAINTWDVYATLPGETGDPLNPTDIRPFNGAGGDGKLTTLTFNVDGTLSTGGTFTQSISDPRLVQLQDPLLTDVPFDFSGLTQYAANYSVSELRQDGYASGALIGIEFDEAGIVTATYSNGQTDTLGVVQLANFTNLQGLQSLGGNLWAAGYEAGEITLSSPGTGIFGSLQAGALEESNVDLTSELVNMITAQRFYQANAQTIKAQDQMLQTLVNLR